MKQYHYIKRIVLLMTEYKAMKHQTACMTSCSRNVHETHCCSRNVHATRWCFKKVHATRCCSRNVHAIPVAVPGMFMLPVAGVKAINAKLADLQSLKEYRLCKVETMALMTDQILESFLDRSSLSKLIGDQMQIVTQNVDAMIRSIPNIIEGDRVMINKLQEEREATETSLAEQYLPLYQKCQALQGRLDYFYAAKVRIEYTNTTVMLLP